MPLLTPCSSSAHCRLGPRRGAPGIDTLGDSLRARPHVERLSARASRNLCHSPGWWYTEHLLDVSCLAQHAEELAPLPERVGQRPRSEVDAQLEQVDDIVEQVRAANDGARVRGVVCRETVDVQMAGGGRTSDKASRHPAHWQPH
jgi:hypothetical protein